MIKETSKCTIRVHSKIENASNLQPPMTSVIWNQLAFPWTVTFYQFLLHALGAPEGKVMILLSKFFEYYWIHSTPFSVKKVQLLCSGSHRSEFQVIVLCVYLLLAEIFFCLWPTIKHFPLLFQSEEWAGNFVVCSLEVTLRIISLRLPFGLPVWNFGHPRVNCRRLWQPGAH